MIDGDDERRKPLVGREGRRKAGTCLLDGVAITVAQKVSKLSHVRRAVDVTSLDHRSASGSFGEVAYVRLYAGGAHTPIEKPFRGETTGEMTWSWPPPGRSGLRRSVAARRPTLHLGDLGRYRGRREPAP